MSVLILNCFNYEFNSSRNEQKNKTQICKNKRKIIIVINIAHIPPLYKKQTSRNKTKNSIKIKN